VLKAGICSTLQDAGRRGYRAYGVPASGALDAVALALVNTLVGNRDDEAAIEMLYSGVSIRVQSGSARVAVAGTDAVVERAAGAREPLPGWQTITLMEGDTLRVGTIGSTAVAYLALEGGFDVPHVLGSASTYLRGSLGGFNGRALKSGDVVAAKVDRATARAESRYSRAPQLKAPAELRVISGPQAERFDQASLRRFVAAPYTVSTASDRSGLRLEGEPLNHVSGFDLTSEGVAPGSIQVPGSGLPVMLIGDHPTVGGYPKIATIVSADIPAAGRLRIGSRVSFRLVDEDEARRARESSKRYIEETIASLCDAPYTN
jgi:biotin-dependent carboxylase-like uncharacterized protein